MLLKEYFVNNYILVLGSSSRFDYLLFYYFKEAPSLMVERGTGFEPVRVSYFNPILHDSLARSA
ncbi:hypothetical protein [Aquimarina hainanensis]|uniref:hypothetical protein n=1 Tax=Aquimarina hainanensis TaxID=1578017 RepID=UPI0036166431